jgi:hypothetical protein
MQQFILVNVNAILWAIEPLCNNTKITFYLGHLVVKFVICRSFAGELGFSLRIMLVALKSFVL